MLFCVVVVVVSVVVVVVAAAVVVVVVVVVVAVVAAAVVVVVADADTDADAVAAVAAGVGGIHELGKGLMSWLWTENMACLQLGIVAVVDQIAGTVHIQIHPHLLLLVLFPQMVF